MKYRGKLPDGNKLLEADDIIKLKRCILGAKVFFLGGGTVHSFF